MEPQKEPPHPFTNTEATLFSYCLPHTHTHTHTLGLLSFLRISYQVRLVVLFLDTFYTFMNTQQHSHTPEHTHTTLDTRTHIYTHTHTNTRSMSSASVCVLLLHRWSSALCSN